MDGSAGTAPPPTWPRVVLYDDLDEDTLHRDDRDARIGGDLILCARTTAYRRLARSQPRAVGTARSLGWAPFVVFGFFPSRADGTSVALFNTT